MHAQHPDAGRDRALLLEHGDAVGKVCMALLGDRGAAQAAVEETFVQALEGLAQRGAQQGETVRGWLFGIVQRVCARQVEVELARKGDRVDTQRIPGSRSERMRGALAELKPTERDAVVLRCVGGLGVAEIAQACRIDERTARERLNGGLSRVRAALGSGK